MSRHPGESRDPGVWSHSSMDPGFRRDDGLREDQYKKAQTTEKKVTVLEVIREILTELLDIEPDEIGPQSYLVRDLGVESIDFLELAVALNGRFGVDVHDDTVFLRNLRLHLSEASEGKVDEKTCLKTVYPYLAGDRLDAILLDLDGGPVLQVQDLESYVQWQMTRSKAA